MIESMTGFGRGSAEQGGVHATVEIRSVNNRFADVSVRLPRVLSSYENEVQNLVKGAFDRGKFNVSIQTERADETVPLGVDTVAVRRYVRLLEGLREAAGLSDPVRLDHLLQFPELLAPPEDEDVIADAAWGAVQQAMQEAIRQLHTMRRQEGEALRNDLVMRLSLIEQEAEAIESRAPERVIEARDRLKARLAEVIADQRVDPARLEQEIAFIADKLDITEEIVRLRSHLHLFRDALQGKEPAGRKLNFLVQELNREVNTVSSKANDPDIAHRSVRMKEELERIREQVQNIE